MPLREDDLKPFGDMLNAVAGLYGRDLSTDVVRLYWAALRVYDLAAVRKALDRHVKNPDSGQYMPKPADVIRMLGGTTADGAMQAWAKVEGAIRRVGGHESVVFDDAVIHRCVEDMGGWPRLCETLESDLPFRARDFQALYRGYALRGDVPAYRRHLIGRFEAENERGGRSVAPPVLIGDAAACAHVLAGGGDAPQLRVTHHQPATALIDGGKDG